MVQSEGIIGELVEVVRNEILMTGLQEAKKEVKQVAKNVSLIAKNVVVY